MARSSPQIEADTERAFLDAAEQLFAERGFEGTKVRAISDTAGTNLGALHYYWGSKEELFRAVWRRRLDIIQERRSTKFAEMRKKAAEEGITVEEVITVLVETSFGVTDPAEPHSQYFGKLYGRALSDPSPTVQKVVNQYYDERARGFVELMHLACPSLGETELYWGLHSVFGAMLNIHTDDGRMSRVVPLTQDETNLVHGAEPIIRFLAAGFKALADVPKQTRQLDPPDQERRRVPEI